MPKHTTAPSESVTDHVESIRPNVADAMVDHWFIETFHNRAIAPDEFNRLTAAKDRLKTLLRGVKE